MVASSNPLLVSNLGQGVIGSRYRRTPMNHGDAGCGPISSGRWRHSNVIATDSGRAAGASDGDYRVIVVSVLLPQLMVAVSPVPLSVTASFVSHQDHMIADAADQLWQSKIIGEKLLRSVIEFDRRSRGPRDRRSVGLANNHKVAFRRPSSVVRYKCWFCNFVPHLPWAISRCRFKLVARSEFVARLRLTETIKVTHRARTGSGPAFARRRCPRIPCQDKEALRCRPSHSGWQAVAGSAAAGQGCKPRSGGAERTGLDEWHRSGLASKP
jgi:hypothetical protein